jgi:hypothetical protein
MVVAAHDDSFRQTAAHVAVHLGNRDGTFQTVRKFPLPSNPRRMAVGDLTGDGRPEVLVMYDSGGSLLRNSGDGSYAAASPAALHFTSSYAFGDLTHDGVPDLILGSAGRGSSQIQVFRGGADVALTNPLIFQLPREVSGLGVADMNLDGLNDLVIASDPALDAGLYWMQGAAGGQLGAPRRFTSAPPRVGLRARISLVDLNADAREDLVVLRGNAITVHLKRVDGSFDPRSLSYFVPAGSMNDDYYERLSAFTDWDGDGFSDLVSVSHGGVAASLHLRP